MWLVKLRARIAGRNRRRRSALRIPTVTTVYAPAESHAMKTILLIDDSVMLRMTFGNALREVGYNVIEADSGVQGLALARQHLPDLILSDVQMPGGDGSSCSAISGMILSFGPARSC